MILCANYHIYHIVIICTVEHLGKYLYSRGKKFIFVSELGFVTVLINLNVVVLQKLWIKLEVSSDEYRLVLPLMDLMCKFKDVLLFSDKFRILQLFGRP